ncbi:MAG: diaminopimelate decarboxylase [Gammaproteobacteria bacterium]
MNSPPFHYRSGELFAEDVSLAAVAREHGTPCYVYSAGRIESNWRALDAAFAGRSHLVCYAVKANSNLAVLGLLARLGSGFDIVSIGELERVLAAGGRADRVVFAGVGKREDEIRRALLAGIRCFNVESRAELERIDRIGTALGRRAPVALRVNPDVDPGTHPYIATGLAENKFGIPIGEAVAEYERAMAMSGIEVTGIACHIGSQLTALEPFSDALASVSALVRELRRRGVPIRHVDAGGGLGVRYRDETPPAMQRYAAAIGAAVDVDGVEIVVEPGRAIVADAGVLLTRVEYLKPGGRRSFAIVDAAMNDLIRPALYEAWHEVRPVAPHPGAKGVWDVVGPVCETGDFLAQGRELALAPGDLLVLDTAGAYGFAMSSNYNARPRPAEVMVRGAAAHLVRARETIESLYAGERLLPGA